MRTAFLLALAALLAPPPPADDARPAFSDGKAGFTLRIAGETVPCRIMALPVLPAAKLRLEIVKPEPQARYVARTPDGTEHPVTRRGWSWTAPTGTGLYPLRVSRAGSDDEILLNVFVIVPLDRVKKGVLNGYRIGTYPAIALRGLEIYNPPRGFIEVTKENEETPVAPHFRLGQFVCKQAGDYPKYIVLRPRLLLKLELLLQRFNAAGFRADTFEVMSGYRTPYYNDLIGNVKYSRHLWGGAADIFIDEDPKDDNMDDLNGDGLIDYRDAAVIYDVVDQLYGEPWYRPLVGGLARYRRTDAHGPFVHVDVRGYHARWGD
jgi:hypothetical protein